jgi:hypothetical protein
VLMIAGGKKRRLGKHVREVNQLQQGDQGCLPTSRLSLEGCRFSAAVGAAQGICCCYQLAKAAAAAVLADDPAVGLAAAREVPTARPDLPSHFGSPPFPAPLCFSARQASVFPQPGACEVFKRPPPFAGLSTGQALSLRGSKAGPSDTAGRGAQDQASLGWTPKGSRR